MSPAALSSSAPLLADQSLNDSTAAAAGVDQLPRRARAPLCTLSVGFIGPGAVGSALLDQLASERARLRDQFNLNLSVRGIVASRRMALFDSSTGLKDWRAALDCSGPTLPDLDQLVSHLSADRTAHPVLIDCSASEDIALRYAGFFERGVHVVTSNKRAQSADNTYVRQMSRARRASGAHYLYEATVGAGLPVVRTARELRQTGDDIQCIEGTFSGTLAYLFNVYDGSAPFSAVVADAKARGFTEPDPREDLSGRDVARKLIILAREMGLTLELSDVEVESLVPAELQNASAEAFMRWLPAQDEAMRLRLERARARGRVLRHVGRVSAAGEVRVGVIEVDARGSFANTALSDNIVRFTTRRYSANPLIVQGPGAGAEVTAGGVFADLLRLASYLGVRL